MFTTREGKNYVVKLSKSEYDELYHIFIKGMDKELTVGLWDIVYDDIDIEEEKIFDISELSTQDLQSLDMDSLVEQGYKILF